VSAALLEAGRGVAAGRRRLFARATLALARGAGAVLAGAAMGAAAGAFLRGLALRGAADLAVLAARFDGDSELLDFINAAVRGEHLNDPSLWPGRGGPATIKCPQNSRRTFLPTHSIPA